MQGESGCFFKVLIVESNIGKYKFFLSHYYLSVFYFSIAIIVIAI